MGLNINGLKTAFTKVNSKGASLLRKETSLDALKAAQEGVIVPKNAKTYDAVRVGRNFKPEESYTDIFTFRDAGGNIVKRYTRQVDGTNIKETTKGFENIYPWEKDLDEFGDEVLEISARKVRSHVRENGKISKITEDVFAVTDEAKPVVTHSQKTITRGEDNIYKSTNYETFLLEQRQNGTKPSYIKNEYEIDKHANGYFDLTKSEASSPELKEIAQNSYLLPYVSNTNKFAHRMSQAAIEDGNFILSPSVNLYKKTSSTAGFCSADDVYINLKSSKDLSMPRESLTETIGHEVGHAKWNERVIRREMYQMGMDDHYIRDYSPAERIKIKMYADAAKTVADPRKDFKKYYENFREVTAREEGQKAVRKYFALKNSIDNQFPYLHGFQFYPPVHNEDDIRGLISFIGSLK